MEEGRCDENVQGQLKTVLEKLAKEQSSHAKTESLVWKMGYWLRCQEADLERASFKHSRAQQHIKAMQSDRKELKNPCVLFKERIRRGQCQHVVKKAAVACETAMMRNDAMLRHKAHRSSCSSRGSILQAPGLPVGSSHVC